MGLAVVAAQQRVQPRQRARVTNLWRRVQFVLEGERFELRLVQGVADPGDELSVASPVGRSLLTAKAGESVTVNAPGGDVIVKVLEVF